MNVQKIFPKLTSKIAKNEYRTQNNKRHLTQHWFKGVSGEGVLGRRYMFLLGQKEQILANIGREPILGAPKPPKRNIVLEIQERALEPGLRL